MGGKSSHSADGESMSYYTPGPGGGFTSVGRNVRIHQMAVIANPAALSLGDDVRIDAFTIISAKHVEIGSHVHIGGHCLLSGRGAITIGSFCGISNGVKFFTSSDKVDIADHSIADDEHTDTADIHLERHATLCANVVVMPGVTFGRCCYVGAFSLVKKDIPEYTIASGIPAKVRRVRKLTARDFDDFERRYLEAHPL